MYNWVKCHINCSQGGNSIQFEAILNDGSDIAASDSGVTMSPTSAFNLSITPQHAEVYAQGVVTFEARAKVTSSSMDVEEKTMIIEES